MERLCEGDACLGTLFISIYVLYVLSPLNVLPAAQTQMFSTTFPRHPKINGASTVDLDRLAEADDRRVVIAGQPSRSAARGIQSSLLPGAITLV